VAEKTVAQTREVYERSTGTLDASIEMFERTFDAAGQGAAAFNRKIIDIAQRNVNSVFDLAKNLASAKDLAAVVELQTAYWQKQFSALTTQAEEVRALSTKVTADAGEPLKPWVPFLRISKGRSARPFSASVTKRTNPPRRTDVGC
jgi:hypothetical protein